jgi:hypothetical protein
MGIAITVPFIVLRCLQVLQWHEEQISDLQQDCPPNCSSGLLGSLEVKGRSANSPGHISPIRAEIAIRAPLRVRPG